MTPSALYDAIYEADRMCKAERGCAMEISMPDLDCQQYHRAIRAVAIAALADAHVQNCGCRKAGHNPECLQQKRRKEQCGPHADFDDPRCLAKRVIPGSE